MFRVSTDNFKVEKADIEQEKIDDAYNLALSNVLQLLKENTDCEHDWRGIPNYNETEDNWAICKK